MIGRLTLRKSKEREESSAPKSFDDYELRLGDMMRGERATMGKSLLDVQRELRIKASYVAAIENSDPSAFDTPGFIAGYVRSYARYLNMDPDVAFETFCRESGFSVAHGMSAEASSRKPGGGAKPATSASGLGSNAFSNSVTPFAPESGGWLSHVEPRAIGSMLVLVALIGGIGYGGWSILKEVQQVQTAPVDQTPLVLADVDPLHSARRNIDGTVLAEAGLDPSAEALDRLYRPQALDVPVLVARDAPIATLDPQSLGYFSVPELPSLALADATVPAGPAPQAVPQVVEEISPGVELIAVRPSWVQVTAADGSVIYEAIMNAGDRFPVPLTEEAPKLRTGESGALYFAVNGNHFGPVGDRGQVSKNIDLSVDGVMERFEVADLSDAKNQALATMVAELRALPASE